VSRHVAIALLTGGLGLPGAYAPGLLTDLVGPNAPGDPVRPEVPGWGEAFGDFEGGPPQVAPTFPGAVVPDDGGVRLAIDLVGAEPGDYLVSVGGVSCFSGVPGQGPRIRPFGPLVSEPIGEEPVPYRRHELRFIVPAGLRVGQHDVVLTLPDARQFTFTKAVQVVRRPRRSRDYSLRALFPASAYAGGRGHADASAEPVLEPDG
jgi:hypothetical protein